jgi:hypothetical protein
MTADTPHELPIRRRSDGSIDLYHYDARARRVRAREQRAALWRLTVSLARLVAHPRQRRAPAHPATPTRERQAATVRTEADAARVGVRGAPRSTWLAALLAPWALAVPPVAANAGGVDPPPTTVPVSLPVLASAMTGWVAAELGERVPDVLPEVLLVDRATLGALARSDETLPASHGSEPDLQALYRFGSRTIHLPSDWTGATAAQMSILVHEIVHHFQALRGDIHACPAAREELAFAVQARWLKAHGESLESAFGVEPLFLIVATNCLF